MSYTSQKIREAAAAFYKSPQSEGFLSTLEEMTNGRLRGQHLERAKKTFQAWMQAEREVLFARVTDTADRNPGQSLKNRILVFTMIYMSANAADPDDVYPVGIRVSLSQPSLVLCLRLHPLVVSSGHTEFRHIQRTARAFKYTGNDFLGASQFSIPLSLLLESYIPNEENGFSPFVIPHAHGFFLGTAQRTSERNRPLTFVASYSPDFGKYGGDVLEDVRMAAPTTINIKTSISFRLFSRNQSQLYEALRPFREDARLIEGLDMGVHMYSLGDLVTHQGAVPPQGERLWEEAFGKLSEIVKSDMWREESTAAWRNFRRLEFN